MNTLPFLVAAIFPLVMAKPAWAQKDPLTPFPRVDSAKERVSYFDCRKNAIDEGKKKKNRERFTKLAVNQCREQFPAAANFVECKRDTLKKFKDEKSVAAGLRECRKKFGNLTFRPNNPLPFTIDKGKAYFAGAGLNLPRRLYDPKTQDAESGPQFKNSFSNFSCQTLENAVFATEKPEYLLFGNDLRLFSGFQGDSAEDILNELELTKPSGKNKKKPLKHDVFGELFPKDDSLITYFPLSFCHFERDLGPLFEGIKIYYLLDKERKFVTPYFGIAFYKPNKPVKIEKITMETLKILGPGYKKVVNKKGVIYLTKHPLDEFDHEGDPLNLCREKADGEFIGIIKPDKSQEKPEYFLLSNISNLCKYGNRLATGFTN